MPLVPLASIGERPHQVSLQNPGPLVRDADGQSSTPWFPLSPPTAFAKIEPATAAKLERIGGGAARYATATHIVTFPFHPQVSVATRVLFRRPRAVLPVAFSVIGVANPEELGVDTVAICVELVNAPPLEDTSWMQTGWMQ